MRNRQGVLREFRSGRWLAQALEIIAEAGFCSELRGAGPVAFEQNPPLFQLRIQCFRTKTTTTTENLVFEVIHDGDLGQDGSYGVGENSLLSGCFEVRLGGVGRKVCGASGSWSTTAAYTVLLAGP